MDAMKIAKAALGVVVVIVLFVVVMNWWGDYRTATAVLKGAKASSGATTSTVTSGGSGDSGATQPDKTTNGTSTKVLLVAVDGLNFRAQPNSDSKSIRGLSKGERVTLLATVGDWYKVEDSSGVIGYITANPTYTDTVD